MTEVGRAVLGLGPRCALADQSTSPDRAFRASLPRPRSTRNTLPHRNGEGDPQIPELPASARPLPRLGGADPDPRLEDLTFYADTWELLINRRDPSLDTLLQPHNEHLVMIPVLDRATLLRLFGMTSALPEYVLLTALLLVTAALFFVYVKRRVGSWPALFVAVLLLFSARPGRCCCGRSRSPSSAPSSSGWRCCSRSNAKTVAATSRLVVCLVVSLGFSSLALPFVLGAAVAILQGAKRTWARRAYVVAVPVLLFVLWYLGWGHEPNRSVSLHNVLVSPRFVLDSIAVVLAALFGFGTSPLAASASAWKWALVHRRRWSSARLSPAEAAACRPVSGRWWRWRRPTGS